MIKNNLPLVSIITPSLNQGEFIEETILSIKNQSYPHIEHVIVDGGSTDNTLEILKRHEGTYNMRWVSEPDNGMYQAINKGMRRAKGEILAYLNTDDLYFPWTVKAVVKAFTSNPSVQIFYGDCLFMEDDKATLYFSISSNYFVLKFLLSHIFLAQPTAFWRRAVFEKLEGFNENLRLVGDLDYWIRAVASFKMSRLKEFLAVHRLHPESKTFLGEQAMAEEAQRVRSTYYNSGLRTLQRSIGRFYSPLWLRYNTAKFLYRYFFSSRKRDGWSSFLSLPDLRLPPLRQCLLDLVDFLPFVGRGKPKRTYVSASLTRKIIFLAPREE